jgi:hypothetical protein
MAAACFALIMVSCDDMNSLHEKYLDRGIDIYIGATDSISVESGLNKVGFKWKINADPRINKVVISWEEPEDGAMVKKSATIPVERTTDGEMWMNHVLYDLPEAEYIFIFQIFDSSGNTSKTVEISGSALGNIYVENLRNRNFKSISKLETGQMMIDWELAPSGTLEYSVVEYVNTNGETVKVEVPNDEEKTYLEGLDTGDEVEIYGVHLPENGMETFQSIGRYYTMPKFERLLDKARFKDAFKPGDNTSPQPGDNINAWANTWPIGDNRDIRQLWDNNARNDAVNGFRGILHTNDKSGDANPIWQFPHKFTFEIGTEATLTRLVYQARVDNGSFTGHSPRFFEVWATDIPKTIDDFGGDQAAFEKYYRTTYVIQKDPNNYVANDANYTDKLSKVESRCVTNKFVASEPEPGIYNWQEDWVKLGDFEAEKPSGLPHGQRNDADNSVWTNGFDFSLPDVGKKVRYIRLVVKFPNWDTSNCINIGEVTFYGDDI